LRRAILCFAMIRNARDAAVAECRLFLDVDGNLIEVPDTPFENPWGRDLKGVVGEGAAALGGQWSW